MNSEVNSSKPHSPEGSPRSGWSPVEGPRRVAESTVGHIHGSIAERWGSNRNIGQGHSLRYLSGSPLARPAAPSAGLPHPAVQLQSELSSSGGWSETGVSRASLGLGGAEGPPDLLWRYDVGWVAPVPHHSLPASTRSVRPSRHLAGHFVLEAGNRPPWASTRDGADRRPNWGTVPPGSPSCGTPAGPSPAPICHRDAGAAPPSPRPPHFCLGYCQKHLKRRGRLLLGRAGPSSPPPVPGLLRRRLRARQPPEVRPQAARSGNRAVALLGNQCSEACGGGDR